ncbi:hypothetical protein [Novosphingobium sp. BL-52-GroH]|uniref:DUF7064 domain-containing protein n=1 Tax=Novosphingobium sp. BL-52-GroH TaxID=3349877 RepID=UPI00384B66F2
MIHEHDILFHTPQNPPYDWAETGFFGFYVPEANILGWVYIVHRAGVGATVADVEIIDRWSPHIHDALYMNMTNHNPLPQRAELFELPNGLRFHARSLREYALAYQAAGIALDLEVSGLMPPYDIHDADMDPMATDDAVAAVANSGFGAAYSAHFDMTVRVSGSLRLGAKTYRVDCVATMDHSWGPRPETGIHPILWANAHFHENYAFHGIFAYDREAAIGEQHVFKHGYALIDGQVRGAVAGSVRVKREGLYATEAELRITDRDGREHVAHGEMMNHHPWMPYGNNLGPMSLARWKTEGRDTGHGIFLEGFPLNRIRAA